MYEQYGEIREVFNLIEKRGMVFVTFVSFPPLVSIHKLDTLDWFHLILIFPISTIFEQLKGRKKLRRVHIFAIGKLMSIIRCPRKKNKTQNATVQRIRYTL